MKITRQRSGNTKKTTVTEDNRWPNRIFKYSFIVLHNRHLRFIEENRVLKNRFTTLDRSYS